MQEEVNMVRKKVDERVRTLIENCSKTKHRSFFVLVGDHGKDQVANLHYVLTKSRVQARPSVLWCYKKELGFSTHKQKRMRQIKKQIQRGLYDANKEDPFELFIASTDIRWCYYKETEKILGSTYGMCVLQDFEAVTPNIMARTIETVEGGGIVIMLLRTMDSLKKLYTMTMDVHSRFRTESHHDVVPRFNERFLLSLTSCETCVVLDDELNVLPISKHVRNITPIATADATNQMDESCQELKDLQASLKETLPVGPLVEKAKTVDQARAVLTFVEAIAEKKLKCTVALTAGRGRGKSAALGISMAGAVAFGYSNIFVTSPSPENLKTVFKFVFEGLEALQYKEHTDYEIIQSTNPDFHKAVIRVNLFREHRQTIQYIDPNDHEKLAQAELLIIDEAAAIPLPVVKKLLGPYLVFMSSTINGYEGTGRSLSLKLIQDLRKAQGRQSNNIEASKGTKGQRKVHEARWAADYEAAMNPTGTGRILKEITLHTPIRYGSNDAVEKWLNDLLCLDAESASTRLVSGTPHPTECELFAVDRDALFSYHKLSESFLQRLMALYVSSHYKNSPNDLQLLSDAPAHQLYVLLGPSAEGQGHAGQLPDVFCVIQVALEGAISRESVNAQLSRGKRASGDLIPWTVSQQFQDSEFAGLSGARIVRIATHPDVTGMGYGSRALQLLTQYFSGEMVNGVESSPVEEPEAEVQVEKPSKGLQKEKIKPRKTLPPLLTPVLEAKVQRLHWIGSSFGLTSKLYNFWSKAGFSAVYVRQTTNDLTGEHTAILLRALPTDDLPEAPTDGWLSAFLVDAKRRFVSLLAHPFDKMEVSLALGLLTKEEGSKTIVTERSRTGAIAADEFVVQLTPFDVKRLESYAKNMVDYHMILDLLPTIARMYFLNRFPELNLSYLQRAILIGMGLQHKSVDTLQSELNLPSNQLLALFNKAVRKFNTQCQNLMDSQIESEMKSNTTKVLEAEEALKGMTPTSVTLEEELQQGQTEALTRLQAESLHGIDLAEFTIADRPDAEWKSAMNPKGDASMISLKSKKTTPSKSKEEQPPKKKQKKNGGSSKKKKYANAS